MNQVEKAHHFRSLHRKGAPLFLYNIWDAGGARAVAGAGAAAVATGSWSLAAAHGFEDGEEIPLELVLTLVARITASVDVPVTVDFEGGYAAEPDAVAANVSKIIRAGAVGINFEDRIVGGAGLYSLSDQVERIRAIRGAAEQAGVPLFVNARTDLFLGADSETHGARVKEALERARAYEEAGADGFFVPGLAEASLIAEVVDGVRLPVNVMVAEPQAFEPMRELGVSRVSLGPAPYVSALADLRECYKAWASA